jgi:Protein of unknown function (DUF3618)
MTTESQKAPTGLEAKPPAPEPPRTASEIEADIEHTRARLAGTVDAIAERVKPANVAKRTADSAKAQVLEPDGSLRTMRVAALVGGLLAVIALVQWRRGR